MAKDDPVAMTPVAAVVRHVEWLEFALAAARDEETRRRERLAGASDKNREKRTVRLAEVTAEVRELGALVEGLKNLQARPAAAARSTGARRRKSPSSARKSTAKPKAAASATPRAAAAATSKATASPKPRAKAAAKPRAASAAPKPRTTAAPKPRARTAAKPKTTRTAKPKTTPAKPGTARTTKRAPRRRGSGPSSGS